MASGHTLPGQTAEPPSILREIWRIFVDKGHWPTTFELDRVLYRHHGVGLVDALTGLPDGLVWPEFRRWSHVWQPDENTTISPTVAGLRELDDAQPYLKPFLRTLRYVVARAATFDPPTPRTPLTVRSEEIAELLRVNPDAVALRVIDRLLETDTPGIYQSKGRMDGGWSLVLNELGARRYDKVETIDDFINLRAQDRADYDEQMLAMRSRDMTPSEVHPASTTRLIGRPWVKALGGVAGAVVAGLLVAYLTGVLHLDRSSSGGAPRPTTRSETVGGPTQTWTNYTNGGGNQGPTIGTGATVQVSCRVTGLALATNGLFDLDRATGFSACLNGVGP